MEIINNLQKEILKSFPNIVDSENFYLTGGTALSLFYLKHRISNDLDFFTPNEEIIIPFSYKLEDFLKTQNITVQRQRSFHSFVELLATQNDQMTSIHLAFDSPFRLEKMQEFNDNSPEMLMLIESVSFMELSVFFNEWKEEISKKLLDN